MQLCPVDKLSVLTIYLSIASTLYNTQCNLLKRYCMQKISQFLTDERVAASIYRSGTVTPQSKDYKRELPL